MTTPPVDRLDRIETILESTTIKLDSLTTVQYRYQICQKCGLIF